MTDALTAVRMGEIKQAETAKAAEQAKTVKNFAKIDAAAKEFEAVFAAEMLKPMFEGLEPDPLFGGGKGEEVFQGFLVQEYGKQLAETGALGIADYVRAELLRIQEGAR